MGIYSCTVLTVSSSMLKRSRAKWVMAQLWALHHPPLLQVASSVILWQSCFIPHLLMWLLGFLGDSNGIKTRSTPSSIFPIKCQFHAPFFFHWPWQSLWNPAASLPQLLPQARQFSCFTFSPLLPTRAKAKTRSNRDSKDQIMNKSVQFKKIYIFHISLYTAADSKLCIRSSLGLCSSRKPDCLSTSKLR